jgi:transcriptional regulatory protein GAL4
MDKTFYREASCSSQDQSLFEAGNLSAVQALVLLSNYAQTRNKPNTGWNYLGLAVRMALSLGLHREFPDWKSGSPLQREMRRRIWWGLFIFDSGASATFGRPILLPPRDVVDINHVPNEVYHTTQMCLQCPNTLQHLTPSTPKIPLEVNEPTLYSSLIAQSELHLIANHIFNRLLSSSEITASEALSFSSTLQSWEFELPWYFQREVSPVHWYDWYLYARCRLWWRYWNMQIILTRSFLLQWAMERRSADLDTNNDTEQMECRDRCIMNARLTIESIDDYVRNFSLTKLAAWYAL